MGAQSSKDPSQSPVAHVKLSEKEKRLLNTGWPIIVIFGQSGVGKSSFINLIAQEQQEVGESIDSCTDEVAFVEARIGGQPVVIIDTPGIDDTRDGVTEADVLEKIAHRLEATGRKKKWVTGVLYLHRISDQKFTPTARRTADVLEKLCGENALRRVMFCTTMWDKEESEKASSRHSQLCNAPVLGGMIKSGALTATHSNCWGKAQENAEKILSDLIKDLKPAPLAIQTEMIDHGKTVRETKAGQVLQNTDSSKKQIAVGARQPKKACFLDEWSGFEQTSDEERRLLNTDWPIIFLFGQTQTGKSSFINLIAQKQQAVGESIDSCTDRVTLLEATIKGKPVLVVDTPGIDNTRPGVTEADVLTTIARYLDDTGRQKKWVTGVLYLHRITDPKFGPTAARITNMLRKLCGESAMNRVMLCTTMWDVPTSDESKRRHDWLCNIPVLQDMITNGARTATHSNRWDNARENAETILSDLIKDLKPRPLAIQNEMIEEDRMVAETGAGQVLASHFREERAKQTGYLAEIREIKMRRAELAELEVQGRERVMLLEELERQKKLLTKGGGANCIIC